MSMRMEICIFLAYAAGMLAVYLTGRYLMVPLKWTGRILLNSLAGGMIIFLINSVFAGAGIFLPLNGYTALMAGVLGIPGIVLMVLFFA